MTGTSNDSRSHSSDLPAGVASFDLVIGMEVHVELTTRTKMFTRAPSPVWADAAGEPEPTPNTLIDPVVLALPGALPVMNKAAVEISMRVGLALGCEIAGFSKWDRKGYFYPDLPKGYQLSQYDLPLCFDGAVDVPTLDDAGFIDPDGPVRRVRIERAHLEEDAGKLLHEPPSADTPGWQGGPVHGSIVDWNRAGTPLLEIVTAPDLRSAAEAVSYGRLLRDLCRWLDASPGVMQRGHMRFEPNINGVLKLTDGRTVKTPIVEIKNLNSFRALRDAIEFERRAQPGRWAEDGAEFGPGTKTTRGWDDARSVTVLQRSKEDAHDYRYFPDPDLPPVVVDDAWLEAVRASLPELPAERRERYTEVLGLSVRDAAALLDERAVSDVFDEAVRIAADSGVGRSAAARAACGLILQAAARLANERSVALASVGLRADRLAEIVQLRDAGDVSANAAEELLAASLDEPATDARALAEARGLLAVRDTAALDAWCDEAIEAHAEPAQQVRDGNDKALGRLIGDVRKRSGGQADAAMVREHLLKKLRD